MQRRPEVPAAVNPERQDNGVEFNVLKAAAGENPWPRRGIEDHPVIQAIERVRHRTAANFSPEYSGGLGEARLQAIHEVYREVRAVLETLK